jgi:hypothetical protein
MRCGLRPCRILRRPGFRQDANWPNDDDVVTNPSSMSPAEAEQQLFADALTCSGDFPAAFSPIAPESGTAERAAARSEAALHSIALIEDTQPDELDEHGSTELALQRVEAKLNLILDLLGKLARRGGDTLPLRAMRWSRRGVALQQPFGTAEAASGFLLIQAVGWLPQPLELPVECLASAATENGETLLYLRFAPRPPSLEAAIERHLFRLHRRQIAIAKNAER